MKLFSYRNRPVHMGPYPMETACRSPCVACLDLANMPVQQPLDVATAVDKASIRHACDDYLSLLDTIRDGPINPVVAEIPGDLIERANNLKAAGYFLDATFAASCELTPELLLEHPFRHPRIDDWHGKSQAALAKPIPMVVEMAYRRIAMAAKASQGDIQSHQNVIVYAIEFPRDPEPDEPGAEWIQGLQEVRASLLAAEVAVTFASYLRILGFSARAHTATSSDIDIPKAAVAGGIARAQNGHIENPYVGSRFALAAITTSMALQPDKPLSNPNKIEKLRSKGPAWWLGKSTHKNAFNFIPFAKRRFKDSQFPVEKIKTRDEPTTLIDADRIPRVPKRADFFQRSFIGDLGPGPRDASVDAYAVAKHPVGGALMGMLNTYSLLQRAQESGQRAPGYDDPQKNADTIKATLYFLGADLVGISEAPDWVWYSHSIDGRELKPAHKFAITTLVDQGHETMEGASGDDWLSAAQSMRSYMRSSLLNGVVCVHLRNLGFPATNHTASDGDVIQPPLVLLAGLGEVSRIGDVVLNPFLGPRLKCGVITTDLPMQVDKPIDFGLQKFCDGCNKCARECPSGAISAGPKVMFNGYEMWRSDVEKCTRYRMTNSAGSMCGRCMKTCPWNLEGIFKEAPYRFLATKFPFTAPALMRIDDWFGNGDINPVKKWWWDLEGSMPGPLRKAEETNVRGLNTGLKLRAEDQTLACYPANLAPTPYLEPQPLDREAGIAAFEALRTPNEYRKLRAAGATDDLVPQYSPPTGPPPVFPVMVRKKESSSADGRIARFELAPVGDMPLPPFTAGAHIDVMIAPQFIRQYSLSCDPGDDSHYEIGVLREVEGTGGSERIHQRLAEGKMVMISRPRNHFPLADVTGRTLLLAGGVGVTPLIAMGHELHRKGRDFTLYYKAKARVSAAFIEQLEKVPWSDRVHTHFSDEDRLNVADVLGGYRPGDQLYTCGPSAFMDAVFQSALDQGWDEECLHREYFTVPGDIEYENHEFRLRLPGRDVELVVPVDRSAADVLTEAGIPIDTKCSDGLCGVCVADYSSGAVEHRDYVLSKKQREGKVALCCSRAVEPDGEIVLNL